MVKLVAVLGLWRAKEVVRVNLTKHFVCALVVLASLFGGGGGIVFGADAKAAEETKLTRASPPADVDFDALWQAWQIVNTDHFYRKDLDKKKMLEGTIRGMLRGTGDRHAYYLSNDEFTEFVESRKSGRVETKILDKMYNGRRAKIGYVKIGGFCEETAIDVVAAGKKFAEAGVDRILLDLRNNPGGQLSSARGVCGAFLGPDKPSFVRFNGKDTTTVLSTGEGVFAKLPTVCLVNNNSASASEMVCGAIRDGRGVKLIGAKTYGKGSIQKSRDVGIGAIIITTDKWATPNGKWVDGEGIRPDYEVDVTKDDIKRGRDYQMNKAIEVLIGEAK